jgi:hypothetical protein
MIVLSDGVQVDETPGPLGAVPLAEASLGNAKDKINVSSRTILKQAERRRRGNAPEM